MGNVPQKDGSPTGATAPGTHSADPSTARRHQHGGYQRPYGGQHGGAPPTSPHYSAHPPPVPPQHNSSATPSPQQQHYHTPSNPHNRNISDVSDMSMSETYQKYGMNDTSNHNHNANSTITPSVSSSGNNSHGGGGGGGGMAPQQMPIDLLSLEDDTVPTVFRWEHGGRQVYITGTFNGWSRQIPMHRSGNDFTYIHNLKRGKHAFKFIVDDEWRFAPDQPTVADIEGRINNFIDVSDFRPYTGDRNFEDDGSGGGGALTGLNTPREGSAHHLSEQSAHAINGKGEPPSTHLKDTEDGFSNNMPDLDEYTKEPPPLPPHLRHIILNKPPQLSDTASLPVPQHVALNHLYCTAIKDNMMVLGVTQRYKTKFVTTVYYSPCAS